MGIDFEKMKKKLDQANGNGGGSTTWWKPEVNSGITNVRFLPSEDGDPFKEVAMHFSIGQGNDQRSFACPSENFNKDCPVCSYAWDLVNEGKEKQDEQLKSAGKDLLPTQRYYSNVYVRGEEDKGPQVYSYSWTVYMDLVKMVLRDDIGDITDIDDAFDVEVECTKTQKDQYKKTKVQAGRSKRPLEKDEDKAAQILENAPDIMEDVIFTMEKADIESALESQLAGDEVLDEGEGTEKYSGNSESDDSDKTEEKQDLDDVFEELDSK